MCVNRKRSHEYIQFSPDHATSRPYASLIRYQYRGSEQKDGFTHEFTDEGGTREQGEPKDSHKDSQRILCRSVQSMGMQRASHLWASAAAAAVAPLALEGLFLPGNSGLHRRHGECVFTSWSRSVPHLCCRRARPELLKGVGSNFLQLLKPRLPIVVNLLPRDVAIQGT